MGQYYNQPDNRYAPAAPTGYVQVYYDPKTGQYVQPNPDYTSWNPRAAPQFIPVKPAGPGPTEYTPPAVDFNALPQQTIPQAQAYVRPNLPAQNTGSGYRPQFDPTFIQQMLAQRFGNQQPNAGVPSVARPTLTPGAAQSYGGYQGQGGLGALRAMSNPAPAAPMGGNTNAPV